MALCKEESSQISTFIKMLTEDPRSPVGERRDECQSMLRFDK
ncbi:MAG: hypothetical protein AB4080_23655 [Trichodesmium sp.]